MAKKGCPAGMKWDSLVSSCLDRNELPTEPPVQAVVGQVIDSTPSSQASPVVLLSPVLWIFVVLITVGSVLVLALWVIIYKRQTRLSNLSEPGLENLQKTEPPVTIYPQHSESNGQAEVLLRAAEAPSSCPYLHPGAQVGSKWQEDFVACRGAAKHAVKEGEELHACSTLREHRIPLPATELGGTALVTTKTV